MKTFLIKLNQFEKNLSAILLALMALAVMIDVSAREVFSSSVPMASKIAVVLMIWVGFIGVSIVQMELGHLRPEMMDKKFLNSQFKYHYLRLQSFVILAFSSLLMIYAFLYVKESYEFGDKSIVLGVKLWVLQSVMVYSFFSLVLKSLFFVIYPKECENFKKETSF